MELEAQLKDRFGELCEQASQLQLMLYPMIKLPAIEIQISMSSISHQLKLRKILKQRPLSGVRQLVSQTLLNCTVCKQIMQKC